MRAGLVWIVAAVCGVAVFGATLVAHAPKLPAQGGRGRPGSPMGSRSVIPPSLAELESIVRNTPDLRSHYHLARRYEWVGRLRQAGEQWREVVRSAESAIGGGDRGRGGFATLALAEARRALGEGDEGESDFRRASALYKQMLIGQGEDYLVYFRLGWCAHRLGDEESMARCFDQAEQILTREDARPNQSGLFVLAQVRAMRGYDGQALAALEALIAYVGEDRQRFDDVELLEGAEEFERLRGDPIFRAFLLRLKETTPASG